MIIEWCHNGNNKCTAGNIGRGIPLRVLTTRNAARLMLCLDGGSGPDIGKLAPAKRPRQATVNKRDPATAGMCSATEPNYDYAH